MGRIIIFEEGPKPDDSWIGILLLVLYVVGAVVAWPMYIEIYNSSESETDKEEILTFISILLIVCVCIMVLYYLIKQNESIKFSNAFWMICCLTTLIAGTIAYLVMPEEGSVFAIFLVTLLLAGAPSFLATCICILLEERRWKKSKENEEIFM
ncbi:MAG: hypothetical protein J6K04_02185 [Lachnospiraceae bacterium]|nr:hypothetical protein [Lachnospiraceae bacterium]